MQGTIGIIIGAGEVGTALYQVLKKVHPTYIRDIEFDGEIPKIEILHICFPYFKGFEKEVKKYQLLYKPKYTVIHSTVPLDTNKICESYHSPVTGIHPHLAKSLITFTKFLAPKSKFLKEYFEKANIKIKMFKSSRYTEALKIAATTLYGFNIIGEKLIHEWCKDHLLDFNIVYTQAIKEYNKGYLTLGMPQYQMYNLKHCQGEIGGHCIMPNLKFIDNDIVNFIRKQNKRLRTR